MLQGKGLGCHGKPRKTWQFLGIKPETKIIIIPASFF